MHSMSAVLNPQQIEQKDLDSLLRKDLRYQMVFAMAGVAPKRHMDELEDLFTATLLSKQEFRHLRNGLLKYGYWLLDPAGYITVQKEHVDLGELTLHEFTTMTLNLLTRASDSGPCKLENLFIVTNEALKREFYQTVNKALKNLIQKSQDVEGDRLLAWTHIGLDCGAPDNILPGPLC